MKKQIDTIIFDLDGTLLNTLDDLTDSVNYALSACAFKVRELDEVRSFVGNGVMKLIERAVPTNTSIEDINKVFEIFTNHYNINKENKTCPYNGIIEMLKQVKKLGYKSAIVTNKYDEAAKELQKKVFPNLIDFTVGEMVGLKAKPEKDLVVKALEVLGSSTSNSVYVGDSDVDVATAKNCALPIIAVSWGFRTKEFLLSLGVKNIIDSPNQLITELLNI